MKDRKLEITHDATQRSVRRYFMGHASTREVDDMMRHMAGCKACSSTFARHKEAEDALFGVSDVRGSESSLTPFAKARIAKRLFEDPHKPQPSWAGILRLTTAGAAVLTAALWFTLHSAPLEETLETRGTDTKLSTQVSMRVLLVSQESGEVRVEDLASRKGGLSPSSVVQVLLTSLEEACHVAVGARTSDGTMHLLGTKSGIKGEDIAVIAPFRIPVDWPAGSVRFVAAFSPGDLETAIGHVTASSSAYDSSDVWIRDLNAPLTP